MVIRGWLDKLANVMVVVFSLVFSLAFVGSYTAGALQALAAPSTAAPAGDSPAGGSEILRIQGFWILVAVVLVVLLLATRTVRASSLGFSHADRSPRRQIQLIVMMLGVLACLVGWLPQLLVSAAGVPDPNETLFHNTPALSAVASSLSAGIAEEVLVLAVPLVLFERSGLTGWRIGRLPAGWVVVGLVLVAARMAFHLYRGWASVQFLPWAIGAVVAFYWTRALIAMVIGHVTWDLMVLLLPRTALYSTSVAAWYLTFALLAGLGLAAGWVLIRRRELVSSHLSDPSGREDIGSPN